MGRHPKPTKMKIIQGTLRNDRANGEEPILPSVTPGEVQCPSYLTERARNIFKQIREVLAIDMQVMTKADRYALILLADSWDEYMEARKDIQKNGLTTETMDQDGNLLLKTNPNVYIRNNAHKNIVALLLQFGMTPSSRTKVQKEVQQKIDESKQKSVKNW